MMVKKIMCLSSILVEMADHEHTHTQEETSMKYIRTQTIDSLTHSLTHTHAHTHTCTHTHTHTHTH